MKNVSVRKKLLIAFGLLFVIFLCTVGFSYFVTSNISENYRKFQQQNYQAEIKIYDLRLQMNLGV